ncbi:hypothetical protein ACFYVL_31780 [Streptomyces sp. NPDC004111]|uniref:hypothetical protein n=1 Tax=Streptomyces sp. NPDC004111 TaxID=3364690 RepID=UPI00367C1CE2
MQGFLSELAKRLAERWISLLVLPGSLFLAVVFTAVTLGQDHSLGVSRLVDEITAYAKAPDVRSTAGQVVLLLTVLAGSAVAGLVAQALGSLMEHVTLAAGWRRWPGPLRAVTRSMVARRQRRWKTEHDVWYAAYEAARSPDPQHRPEPSARHRAARRRDRIALERPDRPTWIGDRMHAAALRLDRDHHLDLATVWPHLWLILPDDVRAELTAMRASVSRAATLGAWALLYAPLTALWWPAAPLSAVLAVVARHRLHVTVHAFAQALEATTRLHVAALAAQLGLTSAGATGEADGSPGQLAAQAQPQPFNRAAGRALTRYLSSRVPPPSAES